MQLAEPTHAITVTTEVVLLTVVILDQPFARHQANSARTHQEAVFSIVLQLQDAIAYQSILRAEYVMMLTILVMARQHVAASLETALLVEMGTVTQIRKILKFVRMTVLLIRRWLMELVAIIIWVHIHLYLLLLAIAA